MYGGFMIRFIVLSLALTITAVAGEMKSPAIGSEVASFTLPSCNGKQVDLSQVLKSNKAAVVIFISTQCPVSNAYNERMEQIFEKYGSKGIAVIGVNSNVREDMEDVARHAKEHGFRFIVTKDAGNKVADLYGAQVTPEAYVIAPDGKLLYHGRIDDNRNASKVTSHDLSEALDRILSGEKPAVTTLKAFGCSIKRSSE